MAVCRVKRVGGSLMVTIPKELAEFSGLDAVMLSKVY
jgi:antitoxin component of MazEF toxin-antitoxin module